MPEGELHSSDQLHLRSHLFGGTHFAGFQKCSDKHQEPTQRVIFSRRPSKTLWNPFSVFFPRQKHALDFVGCLSGCKGGVILWLEEVG